MNLDTLNIKLKDKSPKEIVKWALNHAKKPIVTTNFRPYEVALLHATSQVENEIKVIWCESSCFTLLLYGKII